MPNLIRALSENGGVVFVGIDSTGIVRTMEQLHKTSAVTSAALGRLLTAAALIGAGLKSPTDKVTLRVNGGGPAGMVVAVANGRGEVKGYVEHPVVELPARADGKLDVGGAVGHDGTLSVVRELGLKEPYVGQTPLVSGEIAEDVTAYYAYSQQTPTVCALGVLVDRDLSILNAGGFLVQLLPGAQEEEIAQLEKNVAGLASVTQMLHEGKTPHDIMELVMAGFAPELLDEQEAAYVCGCTRAHVEDVMLSLGRQQLEELEREDPAAEVCCHYCGKKYALSIPQLLTRLTQREQQRAQSAGEETAAVPENEPEAAQEQGSAAAPKNGPEAAQKPAGTAAPAAAHA